jgi:FeS assembly protein IscX
MPSFSWTDIEDIVLALDEAHPGVDPLSVRFTELRRMVEALDDFAPEPGQSPNEQILEAIQAGWIEERGEAGGGGDAAEGDDTDDGGGYQPVRPFR